MSESSAPSERYFEVSRVVSQTFLVIGRNFVLLFVLALLFTAPPRLLVGVLGQYLVQLGIYNVWGSAGLSFALSMLFGYLLDGAGTRVAADQLSGGRPGLFSALVTAITAFVPLLLTGLVVLLLTLLGMVVLIVPGIMFAVLAIASAPAVVVERKWLVGAIERSANLTDGYRWGVFALLALNAGLSFGFSLLVRFAIGALSSIDMPVVGSAGVVLASVGIIGASLLSTVSTVGVAVIYFELRRVKEGFGAADLASVFD